MRLPSIQPIRSLAAFALLLMGPWSQAEDQILFLGNSFTIGDRASVAEIFDRLAIAGGHEDPNTVMRAVGGQSFQFHDTDATSRAQIASRPWTHVIIQNYSTEPTHIGNVANHHTYGKSLYERIIANNPLTQVILFQTWARAANHSLITGTSSPTSFESTDEMQSELRENYAELAHTLNVTYPANPPVTIAPVGDAWQNAGGLLPESDFAFTDLHGSDNYHGNDNGYYLAAAVIYATIYDQSPEGLHTHPNVISLNLNLTENTAFLEKTAWESVSKTIEIEFVTHPESHEVEENHPVTFTASVKGSRPHQIQWFKDGTEIAGENELSYTIPIASAEMNGSAFTVKVSNDVSSQTSEPAILKVIPDITPPAPGDLSLANPRTVNLLFNESIASEAASDPSNFTVIFQGRRVPVVSSTRSNDGKTITLMLESPIQPGFTVGIASTVTDLSGNPLTENAVVVMKSTNLSASRLLIDFGDSNSPTGTNQNLDDRWNDINTTIGTSNSATSGPLLSSDGNLTTVRLQMVRRFNGANGNGTLSATAFPASATRDSLFGNTESFGGLSNIFPAFRLTGLDPETSYTLTFYASRTGAGDNRETLYTVTGKAVSTATLNPADNINSSVELPDLLPTPAGGLTIELSPTAQNNNNNHFTYLGVLAVSATSKESPSFYAPVAVGNQVVIDWRGLGNLEHNEDLEGAWTPFDPAPSPPFIQPLSGDSRFFRLSPSTP